MVLVAGSHLCIGSDSKAYTIQNTTAPLKRIGKYILNPVNSARHLQDTRYTLQLNYKQISVGSNVDRYNTR